MQELTRLHEIAEEKRDLPDGLRTLWRNEGRMLGQHYQEVREAFANRLLARLGGSVVAHDAIRLQGHRATVPATRIGLAKSKYDGNRLRVERRFPWIVRAALKNRD